MREAKILIVEDSSFLVQIMSRQIASLGHTAKAATRMDEAREILRDWRPEIAIVDLFLPDGNGLDLVRWLRKEFPILRLVIFSSTPKDQLEFDLNEVGVSAFLQKPISKERLVQVIHQLLKDYEDNIGRSAVVIHSPPEQPYEIHVKSCYVCGYDNVQFFVRKPDSCDETWNDGLFPQYQARRGFRHWDHMKTLVSVCPLCLFASKDIFDFSEKNLHADYPYRLEARKVLASGIASRKKLLGLTPDSGGYYAFDTANRTPEQVLQTIQLAQRSGSAMVLGDKRGASAILGFYYTLEYALQNQPNVELLHSALGFFQAQIKTGLCDGPTMSMSYYYSIAIHFALGQSIKANEVKDQLETYYMGVDPVQVTDDELLWNERLLYIWQMGVNPKTRREILP